MRRGARASRIAAALLLLLISCNAPAQSSTPAAAPAAAANPLPDTVQAALAQARVAEGGSAFVVVPLDGGPLQLRVRDDRAMNPASTMKLLTTVAALSVLGPNYRWRTSVFASRHPAGGRLDGDLVVRGGGDPSLVIERWWLLVQRIRALGIRDIRGDLVIDRSGYAPSVESEGGLDGNDLRPYNVAPDALLINFKSVSLDFVPDRAAGVARVVATPALDGVAIPAHVPLRDGACGDWKAQLQADFSHPRTPVLRGGYARSCGEKTWHVSLLTPNEYALASFRALWRAAGGTLHGTVREGVAGADAVLLAEQESPPLAEVIRDINKNSNNVMARQLFLTLGAGSPDAARGDAPAPAASEERSIRAVHAWLGEQGLEMPELVLQNGSGLSREERISAGSLTRLLVHAWSGNEMPDLLASLPLAGVDGTMKNRPAAARSAYVKTGYLADVRALAGYVFASSGHRYVIVAIVNDPHADAAQPALDEFLQWVWRGG